MHTELDDGDAIAGDDRDCPWGSRSAVKCLLMTMRLCNIKSPLKRCAKLPPPSHRRLKQRQQNKTKTLTECLGGGDGALGRDK